MTKKANMTKKRLLVLGASNNASDIRAFADNNNTQIIVAGLKFHEDIIKIADEMYVLNVLDRDELIRLISDKKIDGVFVGGNEDIIAGVIDVSERLAFPFYSTRKIWAITSNKKKFKGFCEKNKIPVVNSFEISAYSNLDVCSKAQFPVVIKPVDLSGSKGLKLCSNLEEFLDSYSSIKDISKSNDVIIEEKINGDEIVVYYTFCDGEVSLTSMGDKYLRTDGKLINGLADVYFYPSKYLNEYKQHIDFKMKKMLLSMGIKNGITSIQGFYTEDGFKFFEMGYRLGGTAQYRYTSLLNNMNSFEMMMHFALTGKMLGYEKNLDNPHFKMKCCTLSFLSKGGTVRAIFGIDEIKQLPGVLHLENRYKVGDEIEITNTVAQFHLRAYLVSDNLNQMKQLISKVQSIIKVYDTNGKSMLKSGFDLKRLDNFIQ